MANASPRYYVHDRAEGQASALTRWSSVNTRYWVMDRTTGKMVDETTTKRMANLYAADLNRAERGAR